MFWLAWPSNLWGLTTTCWLLLAGLWAVLLASAEVPFRPPEGRLQETPLHTVRLPVVAQCARLCLNLPYCESFDFDKVTTTCNIHAHILWETTQTLDPNPDYVHSARSEIPQALRGSCPLNACDVDEVCVPSNPATCIPMPVRLPIRLVNGADEHEGRVEVWFRGQWGTVCDDSWVYPCSIVACRMLGYPDGGVTQDYSYAHFGEATGPIWLYRFACDPGHGDLIDSLRSDHDWYSNNCQHREDSGVRCGP